MTTVNKNIIDSYSNLFEGLDSFTKLELIARLSKSLKEEKTSTDKAFFESFGAFPSDKPAEEIISGIKSSRNFRERDIKF